MRNVSGVSKGGAVGAAGRGGARPASGFTVPGAAASAGTASGTAAAAPAAAVGLALLAAQERGGRGGGRNAAARRRAAAILDELTGLQAELLGGRRDPDRLVRLAALQGGEEGEDPVLRDALRAVSLRARIEMARRSGQQPPIDP